ARNRGDEVYRLRFSPSFGLGTDIQRVLANGKPVEFKVRETRHDVHCLVDVPLEGEMELVVDYKPGVDIIHSPVLPHLGDETLGLKIVDYFKENGRFHLIIEGKGHQEFNLSLPFRIISTRGGEIIGEKDGIKSVRMVFSEDRYERKELVLVIER
ncbi:hypothetical protein CH333_04565, partial [candidate division WOR-3 bacterium JGI_Cruoil_03_44_89]